MLYKIDFTTRNEKQSGSKWLNFSDRTDAVKRFMAWFFESHPADAVRIDLVTEVEIIGDLSGIDLIDEAVEGAQP